MRFNKTILAIFVFFVVILSANAVSAIDSAGDVIGADVTDSTDGADPINVSDSINLSASLDVADYNTSDDENLDLGNNHYSHDEKAAATNTAGGDNNAKVSVDSTATGNSLVVLLAAVAIVGTGFIRNRK